MVVRACQLLVTVGRPALLSISLYINNLQLCSILETKP